MQIKLAVFDIAGTTVKDDNVVAEAFRNAFQRNGYSISLQDAHDYMGVKKIVAVRQMLERLKTPFTKELVEKIHDDFVNEMIEIYESDPNVKPFDDTENVFQSLKERNIIVCLNTGFPKIIADAIVNRFMWIDKGLIDDFIASDEVEDGRPSPLMIQELMARFGIESPEQVAKTGDTVVDIEEGQNAKCGMVIAVTTGSGSKEELLDKNPTHVIASLSEILEII